MTTPNVMLLELIDAAVQDHGKAREILKQHPELRDARYLHNETALHFLAVEGYAAGVEFLAKNGFDVNARNKFESTALLDVCSVGNKEIVEILLQHGADMTLGTIIHCNALHAAIRSANADLVELLLNHGAVIADRPDALEVLCSQDLPRDAAKQQRILDLLRRHGISIEHLPEQ